MPLTAIPGDTPSSPIRTETRGCASSQLQSATSALTSQTVTNDASLDVLWPTTSSSAPMVQTDPSLVQSQNAMNPTIYSPGMYESSGFIFEDVDESFRPLKLVSNLPFCQLEDGLLARSMCYDPSEYLPYLLLAALRLSLTHLDNCTIHKY